MEREELERLGFSVEQTGAGLRVRHPDLNPVGPFRFEAEAWRVAEEHAGRMFISHEIISRLVGEQRRMTRVAPHPEPEPEGKAGDKKDAATRKPKTRRVRE